MSDKQPKETAVPDRTGSLWPLGAEARLVAAMLRAYGADPNLAPVPGDTTDEERRLLMKSRSGTPRPGAPLWLLDYAAAILEQIPERIDRPANRQRDPLGDLAESLEPVMGLPGAVRFVVEMAAYAAAAHKPAPFYGSKAEIAFYETKAEIEAREDQIGDIEEEIEVRAERLKNAIYQRRREARKCDRRRKRD